MAANSFSGGNCFIAVCVIVTHTIPVRVLFRCDFYSTEDEDLDVCSSRDEDRDGLAESSGGESEDETAPPLPKKAKDEKHESGSMSRAAKKPPPTLVLPETFDWNAVDVGIEAGDKGASSDDEMTDEKVSKSGRRDNWVEHSIECDCLY